MSNVPEIRFKGYTDAWEQCKLGEVAETVIGGGTPNTANEEFWSGDIPWLQSSDLTEHDFSVISARKHITKSGLNSSAAKLVSPDSIAIVTRVGVGKLAVVPFEYTTSQDFLSLSALKIDTHFGAYSMYRRLQKDLNQVQGTSIKGITKDELLNKEIATPTSALEQTAIGNFFCTLDSTITFYKRKLDGLRELKKGYLQQMFPQNGERVPRLRFDGFTEDWQEYHMKDLVTLVVREVPKPESAYIRLSVRSHAKGTFHQMVDDPSTIAMDKLFVVRKNDLVVNITFAWEHAIAVATDADDGLLVSHRFPTFLIDKSDVNFIKYSVSFEDFRYKMDLVSPGGAGRNRVLNKNDFMLIKIKAPQTIKEQSVIGSFFHSFDVQIDALQTKLDKLKYLKQAYLQKMFV